MTPTATVCLMSRTANLRERVFRPGKVCLDSPSERREVSEGLDTHGLAGGQEDDSGISRLDELGVVLNRLSSTTVNLLLDLSKLKEESS